VDTVLLAVVAGNDNSPKNWLLVAVLFTHPLLIKILATVAMFVHNALNLIALIIEPSVAFEVNTNW